jgi:hypothetical protein
MKHIIFIILFLSPIFSFSQAKCDMVLYPKGSNPEDTVEAVRIKKISYRGINNYVTVTLQDDSQVKYPKNEIWGYKASDCKIYRYGSKRDAFYLVKRHKKDIIIYSYERGGGYIASTTRDYAFGKNLTGTMYYLNTKNIKEQYGDNECMMQLLDELKWHQHPSNYNKKNKKYKIEEIIEACQ